MEKTLLQPYIGPYAWGFTRSEDDSYSVGSVSYHLVPDDEAIQFGINVGAKLFFTNKYFIDFHIKKGINIDGNIAYEEEIYDKATKLRDEPYPTVLKVVLGIGVQF